VVAVQTYLIGEQLFQQPGLVSLLILVTFPPAGANQERIPPHIRFSTTR
jgi:hypothetical protein